MKRRKQSMGRRTTSKSSGKRKTTRKKGASNLRQTLYGVGLWALGIFNALLIASFIHKHLSTGDEQVLRFEEPTRPQTRVEAKMPDALKLEVLNGCGAKGIAKKFADFLQSAGYEPINVGNFENFDMPNTLILDRKAKNRYNGLRVAEVLGVSPSFVQYLANDETRADVTIIIGKDYPKLDFLRSKK